jgi:hypothetical protein
MYVPRSLETTPVETDESPRKLAEEILTLTKMNWNNTQFDNALPITIKAARQVGGILRYATDDPKVNGRTLLMQMATLQIFCANARSCLYSCRIVCSAAAAASTCRYSGAFCGVSNVSSKGGRSSPGTERNTPS